MKSVSINYVAVFIVTLIVLGVLLSLAFWLFYDNPPDKRKLNWHQILKNNFHLSLIDEHRKTWSIDIFYNEAIIVPEYSLKGNTRLQLKLPIGLKYNDFIIFIKELEEPDNVLKHMLQGIINETELTELHFTRQDLSMYKEFKRHLLLKALKN